MELCSDWLEFSDLTVIEAAYLMIGEDLKHIAYRSERDDAFSYHGYERGLAEGAFYKCDSLFSAIRASHIETTEVHQLPSGDINCERTRDQRLNATKSENSRLGWCEGRNEALLPQGYLR